MQKTSQLRDNVPNGHYSVSALMLHWLTALLIMAAFLLIFSKEIFDLEDFEPTIVFLHKSIGFCVLLLTLPRLRLKISGKSGGSDVDLPPLLGKVAVASHGLFYVLMTAVPLAGWLKVSAAGKSLSLFGIPLPALLEKNRNLADIFSETHEILAYLLLGLIALHIGAALWHRLFHKDGVLYAMLPFERLKP